MSNAIGSVTIAADLDNAALEKEYQKTVKKIEALEAKINKDNTARSPLVEEAKQLGIEYDNARRKLAEMQSGGQGLSNAGIEEQSALVARIERDWDKSRQQVDRYDAAIHAATGELATQQARAGGIAAQLAGASMSGSQMGAAINRANAYMDRFLTRVKQLATRAFVFYVISSALRAMRDWMSKVVKSNDEARAAIARLKGALLTLVQPIVSVVIPAFIALVNVLSRAMEMLARVVSFVFGTTADKSAEAAKALNNQIDALDGVGSASKKASKSMASFDEINQIGDSDASSVSGGGAGGGGAAADFSAFDVDGYKDKISELEIFISGALLVLGAILVFTSANIPVGLGLIAIGAAGLAPALKEAWDEIPGEVQIAITSIMLLLGGVAIVFGVIFLFTGNIPIGLGLIALGMATVWTAAELGVNWDAVPPEVREAVALILLIIGVAAVVFGVIFLFTGHIGLGLGLIVAGMALLWAANEMGVGWDTIPPEVQSVVTLILAILGTVAVIFGVILLFTGHIGLGLGLIVAGAAMLWAAKEMGFSWDAIPPEVQSVIALILAILGTAAAIIGVILLFTGHIPLGLGLIVAGAAMLWAAKEMGFSWDAIPPEVQNIVALILAILGTAAAIIGVIFLFTGNIPFGLGLIFFGAAALWAANSMGFNWDAVPPEVVGVLAKLRPIIVGASLILGVILLLVGAIPLGLALIGIGAAAFFGLPSVSKEETWGEVAEGVGDGLDDVKSEIESHHEPIVQESEQLGADIVEGTATAVEAGEPKVVGAFKSTFNSVLDVAETFSNRYLTSIRSTLAQAAGLMASSPGTPSIPVPSVSPISIPRLAAGAVIPPNREFLAVLGDQKSGTNIEAPLDTIVQAVKAAFSEMNFSGGQQGDIVMVLDGKQFARLERPYRTAEDKRIGVKLVTGAV